MTRHIALSIKLIKPTGEYFLFHKRITCGHNSSLLSFLHVSTTLGYGQPVTLGSKKAQKPGSGGGEGGSDGHMQLSKNKQDNITSQTH